MPSTPATASSRNRPSSRRPAPRRRSPSSAPGRRRCACSATRSPRGPSRPVPACPRCPRPTRCLRSPAAALALAKDVGFPGILKASWGGGGRGMRTVEAEDEFEGRPARGPARGGRRLRQGRRLLRALHPPRPAPGGPDPGGRTRPDRPPVRARLLGAAAQPEDRGMRAGPRPHGRAAGRAYRPCARHRPHRRLPQRGHGGVPVRPRHRRLPLHRGQSAHPGRAHRHRAGDRRGPGAGPDSRRRRRRHRERAGRRLPAAGRDRAARPRGAVPDYHRGPARPLHPRLRPDHRLPRRHRLRHPPRRRHRRTPARSSPATTIRCWRRSPRGRLRARAPSTACAARCRSSASGGSPPTSTFWNAWSATRRFARAR